jgi:iron(III) transport system ATP-binding protein
MLAAIGITRRAGKRTLLRNISFELPAGSTATVLGPSGSGKTTLLRALIGLEPPDAGEVHLDGRCLAREGLHVAPENRGMALVFQEFTLFPHLDVKANLEFGVRGRRRRSEARKLLELLDIEQLERRRIDSLSGGEQQRVALARALAVRPRLLLLDEPFSNIDSMLREQLYGRLRGWLAAEGVSTLIATHDHKEAFYFSDAILVLRDGALIDHNTPRGIYEAPADAWTAEFFGAANFLNGAALASLAPGRNLEPDCRYLVRPEAFQLSTAAGDGSRAEVRSVIYYGTHQDLDLALPGVSNLLRVRCAGALQLQVGQPVHIHLRDDAPAHPLVEAHPA